MAGTKAHLSKLFYSADSGTTYTAVANVTQVQRPSSSKSDIDMTTLASTAKEYELDVPDYGTATFAFNFDGTNAIHQALLADEANGLTRKWKVEVPETGVSTVTSFVFDGTVASCEVTAAAGGKQDGSLNIRVSGGVTDAHGATAES